MLVLTRKLGEGIMLDENVKITLLEISKDRVRIGIDAPQTVKILREEVYSTERQNITAAGAVSEDIIKRLLSGKKPVGTSIADKEKE